MCDTAAKQDTRKFYGDELRAQTPVGGLGAMAGSAIEGPRSGASQPPLTYRLENRIQRIQESAEGVMRARQILSEHPEFEKFLELQSLVNRHGL